MTTDTLVAKTVEFDETLINDEPRTFDDFPAGSVSHQGDVILVAIDGLPKERTVRKDRQVADGNTQGSRHVLVGGRIWDAETHDAIKSATGQSVDRRYLGPVFRGGTLTHPEHGDQTFPKDCAIAVVYQRNLDAEEREQRVVD